MKFFHDSSIMYAKINDLSKYFNLLFKKVQESCAITIYQSLMNCKLGYYNLTFFWCDVKV